MSADWQLQQALSALRAGVEVLRVEDGDMTFDLGAALPDEAADVEASLAAVLRQMVAMNAMHAAAKQLADDMSSRAARFKGRADRLKGIAFAAMDALGKRRLELPDLTASFRAGTPSVLIMDESAIPENYWRVTRSVDKAALAADMKEGVIIAGAEMSNGLPSLLVRSR